jgi:hypothetical protein
MHLSSEGLAGSKNVYLEMMVVRIHKGSITLLLQMPESTFEPSCFTIRSRDAILPSRLLGTRHMDCNVEIRLELSKLPPSVSVFRA